MLCSSRWVILGLAEGVTGWLASLRVAGGSGLTDTWHPTQMLADRTPVS
jgi:hypothetical protein